MVLVGGSDPAEGVVEVCQDNRLGTVCDEDWDELDALVACRSASLYGKPSMRFTGSLNHDVSFLLYNCLCMCISICMSAVCVSVLLGARLKVNW